MTDEPTAERPPWEKDRTKGWAARIRGLPARARRRRGLRRRAYPTVDEAHAPGHRKLGPPPEEWMVDTRAVITHFGFTESAPDWLWPWLERQARDPVLRFVHLGSFGPLIRDADGRALHKLEMDVVKGVSTFVWDLKLDQELALAAEQAKLAKAEEAKAEAAKKSKKKAKKDDKPEGPEKGVLAKTPWAERVRLGRPLYVTPGTYKLVLSAIVLSAAISLRSWVDVLLILVVTAVVVISELFNSAIEALCDFVETNHNEKIKVIKDIAAAAVGISIFVWIVVLIVETSRLVQRMW